MSSLVEADESLSSNALTVLEKRYLKNDKNRAVGRDAGGDVLASGEGLRPEA